jgi:hypothetical protein
MNATKKILTLLLAVLVVSAGAGAATAASIDEETTTVEATYDEDAGEVDLTVTTNGTGVENVSVEANDKDVGTTDANGSLTFDTNATEELELELTKNDTEIEREYVIQDGELVPEEEAEDEADDESELTATATYDTGTVDVLVTKNGSAVENVSVTANDKDVGTTDANGSLTFDTNATEELELEFEKGEMELEQEYTIVNGTLELTETDEDEEDDEGNVTLSANENASDRAHAVLAMVQQFLNSGGEGNLGQQIQEMFGDDRGNDDGAGNSDNAAEKGNADEAGHADNASDKGNSDKAGDKGAGNAHGNGHAADDDDEDDDDDDDDDDTETETDA